VETIVSTYNPDGSSNAAPMGVSMIDEQHVAINFYDSSQTLANVKTGRCAVINLTSDIGVYYRSAFKEENPEGKVPEEWFTIAEAVRAPKLLSAGANVEVTLIDLAALDLGRTRAGFKVDRVNALRQNPQVYCRAFGATVEAIIHATRVEALAEITSESKRVEESLRQIEVCNDVVRHVAPDSGYSVIMADLMKRTRGCYKK